MSKILSSYTDFQQPIKQPIPGSFGKIIFTIPI